MVGEVGDVAGVVLLVRVLGLLVAHDDPDVRDGGRGLVHRAENGVVARRVRASVGGAVAEKVRLGDVGVDLGRRSVPSLRETSLECQYCQLCLPLSAPLQSCR